MPRALPVPPWPHFLANSFTSITAGSLRGRGVPSQPASSAQTAWETSPREFRIPIPADCQPRSSKERRLRGPTRTHGVLTAHSNSPTPRGAPQSTLSLFVLLSSNSPPPNSHEAGGGRLLFTI